MDGPPAHDSMALISWTQAPENQRILRLICANINEKRDLKHVSLAFKAISDIAQDVLWKELPSFSPFINILRDGGLLRDLGYKRSDYQNKSTEMFAFVRNVLPTDPAWACFVRYAGKVESIGPSQPHWDETPRFRLQFHPSFWMKLTQLVSQTPSCFGRLQNLDISASDEAAANVVFSYAALIISPSLKRIAINDSTFMDTSKGSNPVTDLSHFLLSNAVDVKCPLKQLSLVTPRVPSADPLFATIAQLQYINTLTLKTVHCESQDSVEWLSQIGSLPALEVFTLAVAPITDWMLGPKVKKPKAFPVMSDHEEQGVLSVLGPGPPETKGRPSFPSLRGLAVSGPSPIVGALVSLVSSNLLTSITMEISEEQQSARMTSTQVLSCLHMFEGKTNLHHSLRYFYLTFKVTGLYENRYRQFERSPVVTSCGAESLRPIRQLGRLVKLEIATPFSGTTQFVTDTVSHLQNLQHLTIPLSSTEVDIMVLHDIANSCPRLSRLEIPIDTAKIAELPRDTPLLMHSLRHLCTNEKSGWNQNDQLLAARHLNVLFPELEAVVGGNGWRSVWTMAQMIRDLARMKG